MKRALLRNIFNDDIRVNDKKFKFIEERIEVVEGYIPDLKNKTSDLVSRRVAERKSLEKVLLVLLSYADAESVSQSVKASIENLAKVLAQVNGEHELLANSMKEGIVEDLADFNRKCKNLRNAVKVAVSAADKEVIRQRQLQRMEMLRDQDHDRLSTAEAEILKARNESNKAIKKLDEHADSFELQKLKELKSSLLGWTTVELRYHARCLELYTEAYRAVADINVATDHQEFRCKLHGTLPTP